MKDKYVTHLSFYPEQAKEVSRILKKLEKIGCSIYEHNPEARLQLKRLNETVGKYGPFISYSIFDKTEVDPMQQVAELEIINDSFTESEFIRLLQKLSLTNRIIYACKKGEMPDSLVTRLRECVTAYRIWLFGDVIEAVDDKKE